MVHCTFVYIEGFQVIISKFLSWKIHFVLANGTNPDEMPGYEAFHLGLHLFAGVSQLFSIQRVHIYMCLLCMLEQLSCCLHMQNGLAFTAVLEYTA